MRESDEMKTYIRRKGTGRWLRLYDWERDQDTCDITQFDRLKYGWQNRVSFENCIQNYHEESYCGEDRIYQVTQNKRDIIEVQVKEYLEPYFSAHIL